MYQRLGGLKQLLYSWVLWAASFFYIGLKAPSAKLSLGMNTCYGDGAAIPYRTVSHVRDTVWRNLVFNRWEQGDVLMIDNFRVSHGRQVRESLHESTTLAFSLHVLALYSGTSVNNHLRIKANYITARHLGPSLCTKQPLNKGHLCIKATSV